MQVNAHECLPIKCNREEFEIIPGIRTLQTSIQYIAHKIALIQNNNASILTFKNNTEIKYRM